MSWEHTDFSMAPRAGRLDELRNEAGIDGQLRELIKERRSQRIQAIRSHLVKGLTAVTKLVAQPKKRTVADGSR